MKRRHYEAEAALAASKLLQHAVDVETFRRFVASAPATNKGTTKKRRIYIKDGE